MRVDKFLANSGVNTRSKIREIIKKGDISVNGIIIKDASFKVDENKDIIKYKDKIIKYQPLVYIMLNKPSGYVCANNDTKHKTVFELLDKYSTYDLFVAGRLDIDTQGFVLITNDGDFCHRLLSPKKNKYKKYYVETKYEITSELKDIIQSGIEFKDFRTKDDAILEIISSKSCYISISEGKFHQVKRMFQYCSNEVVFLKRVAINNLYLDNNLKLGEYRQLTDDELKLIKEDI